MLCEAFSEELGHSDSRFIVKLVQKKFINRFYEAHVIFGVQIEAILSYKLRNFLAVYEQSVMNNRQKCKWFSFNHMLRSQMIAFINLLQQSIQMWVFDRLELLLQLFKVVLNVANRTQGLEVIICH